MARNKEANQKFLKDRFLNKEATVIQDMQGNSDVFVGCTVKLIEMAWDNARTQFKGVVLTPPIPNPNGVRIGNDYYFHPIELELAPNNEKKVSGLEKRVKTVEEIDRYGNDYIIELYQEDEKIIYLSSALRTLLNIKNKDKVGFALDKKLKKYYIYKEDDEETGHEIIDGKINNNIEWRNLYNTFNPETQHPSKGKLKFHISHYLEKNMEFPELTFYLINENWYEKKVEKPISKKAPTKKAEVLYDDEVRVGSPEWLSAQMNAEINRGRVILPTPSLYDRTFRTTFDLPNTDINPVGEPENRG